METNIHDKMRQRMDEYSDVCRELAKKHNCVLVDFQSMFDKYFSIRHSTCIAWDRVHPNQIGATIIAKAFLEKCEFDYHHIPEK